MNKRKQLSNFSDLMQKKQPTKELAPSSQNMMATILQSMPREAKATIYSGKVKIDGVVRKSLHHAIGLMDVIELENVWSCSEDRNLKEKAEKSIL